jgi:hypothetical protein
VAIFAHGAMRPLNLHGSNLLRTEIDPISDTPGFACFKMVCIHRFASAEAASIFSSPSSKVIRLIIFAITTQTSTKVFEQKIRR